MNQLLRPVSCLLLLLHLHLIPHLSVCDAGEPTPASQVDPEAQQPPPPPTDDDPPASFLEKAVPMKLQLSLLGAIISDAGEPTPASQVDPESQQPPPPPTDDDPPASFLEKVVPVVLQLSLSAGMVASVDPTGRNHGHELAFKLYHLAVLTIYGFDITIGICLIACFARTDRPWIRRAATSLIYGVFALSFATTVLGTVISLLP
ncbi:hypothetical protein OPV22_023942 [Ensete ventricosum]|uniref:PGG domain-containing protein n=1 Tax=Ensete ventricosum TaxID=4639 RepID=A0AAV8PDF2_ENSVE|nr:hypothetical protein OPV22_023942 [Ensete ventricosum]